MGTVLYPLLVARDEQVRRVPVGLPCTSSAWLANAPHQRWRVQVLGHAVVGHVDLERTYFFDDLRFAYA